MQLLAAVSQQFIIECCYKRRPQVKVFPEQLDQLCAYLVCGLVRDSFPANFPRIRYMGTATRAHEHPIGYIPYFGNH